MSLVSEGYAKRRFEFLKELEGLRLRAYDDATGTSVFTDAKPQGNVTIGVGFNMDAPGAKERFLATLPGVSFGDVHSGECEIIEDQARVLFGISIRDAEAVIRRKLRGESIEDNERLALVSLAFNNPSLVGPNLCSYIKLDLRAEAVNEILFRSNRKRHIGLARRRYKEASMFLGSGDYMVLPPLGTYLAGVGVSRNLA